ncbi:MAG: hypothetical protein ABMA13_16735 [Chthoniobacteraceae bacterium]
MDSVSRWLLAAIVTFNLPPALFAQAPKKPAVPAAVPVILAPDIDKIREELGINAFTAPSIEHLMAELMDLRPIPIEKLWRDVPPEMPESRAKIALRSGRIIADGLLAIIAEKPSRIEGPARALARYAKALGVADFVTKHSKSLIEKAAKENWTELRIELVKGQADMEAGMMALKDEEIAHLVSLGGWFRGLEAVTTLIALDYTPEHAKILIQPDALDYFIDRVGTLEPTLREDKVFQAIEKNLKAIQALTEKEGDVPPTEDEVKAVNKLATEVVDLL